VIIPPELHATIAALLDNAVFPLVQDKATAEQVLNEIQRLNPAWARRVKPTIKEMRKNNEKNHNHIQLLRNRS
jgi:hypothetical protein